MRRADDEFEELLGGSGQPVARPGLPVDPGRLWLSVKRDWRWIPFAAAIWLALGLVVAFVFIKHTYRAETILIWEPKGEQRAEQRQLATEAGSLKLPGTLRRVKEKLKLPVSLEVLDKQVDVWFDASSNLVTVETAGPSPADATKLGNGVVAVFLEQQRDIARARADDAGGALESDGNTARARLQKAVAAYDAFRAEHGISDIDQEKQLAIAEVARLKQEQQASRTEATSLDARAGQLESAAKRQGRTSVQSASTNPEGERLAALRGELASARARYSSDHPRLAMLEAQVSALEQRVKKSSNVISNITTSANPEYQMLSSSASTARAEQEAALKRDKSYDQLVQAAEQRLAAISAMEGKARALLAEVKLVEERLGDVETELSQARDAARTPQIEWRVLTPAMEPDWPERSKRRLIVGGMPIAGMLLALLVLMIRPMLDGRVYTAREAGYWANLPVIGSSAWPRSREMFFTLVDELGDQGVGAGGYTLVLGATGREKALAEELAYWLGGGAVSQRRDQNNNVTRMEVAMSTPAPRPQSASTGAGATEAVMMTEAPRTAGSVGGGSSAGPVHPSEALVPVRRMGEALTLFPQGTHAWLGATEGPALRRAARMADRVIVLLSSGMEAFTDVVGLRTRLGRETGVGVVLLGLSPELLKLPDRVGDVDGFWRHTHVRPGA